ncbi:MAG: aspartate carbamoyltransferase regulatory subunit [Candidatus Thermoplasmatota archaeon]
MRDLKVTPIKNGTVIDHIPTGMALKVLKVLGIKEDVPSTVSVLIHVPSKKRSWKDIVKVEDRELSPTELNKIALIAPDATINIIRNYNVAEKHTVSLPERAVGILRCGNPNCITNTREPVESVFLVRSKEPLALRCLYCDRELEDVAAHIV